MFCSEFLIYFNLDVLCKKSFMEQVWKKRIHIYTVQKHVRSNICVCTNTVSV